MAAVPAYDLSLDEMSMALSYVTMALGKAATPAAPTAKKAKKEKKEKKEVKKAPEPKKVSNLMIVFQLFAWLFVNSRCKSIFLYKQEEDDDDDFDVFGDDDDEEAEAPKESRAEMLARLKKEAELRTIAKEAKQRTLVGLEIKPWDTEQDLMVLWKKITETVTQDGLKWAENCHLQEVAFGIKKIVTTFTMGASNSSDDVVEKIEAMEDEVQSVEVTSMNVL